MISDETRNNKQDVYLDKLKTSIPDQYLSLVQDLKPKHSAVISADGNFAYPMPKPDGSFDLFIKIVYNEIAEEYNKNISSVISINCSARY